MTQERMLVFDIADIASIRFDCKHCGASRAFTPGTTDISAVEHCHQCRTKILTDNTVRDLLTVFMEGVRGALGLNSNEHFAIRLVFKDTRD